MAEPILRSSGARATSVVVRMLPALAITVGLLGIAAAATTVAAVGSGMLVGAALVLELGGWGVASRAHAPALGTAALIGALVCALGVTGIALLDGGPGSAAGPTARDGVALGR
jgi:hypothetical protein